MPVKKASGTSETSIIIYRYLMYHIQKYGYFQDLWNSYSLGPKQGMNLFWYLLQLKKKVMFTFKTICFYIKDSKHG
jgi:hypothetical protein